MFRKFLPFALLLFFTSIPPFLNGNFLKIAIFSAPNNFHKRHAIRHTWLMQLYDDKIVQVKFIIGNFCDVPPKYRTSMYGCQLMKPQNNSHSLTKWSADVTEQRNVPTSKGFSFLANRKIIIDQICYTPCSRSNRPLNASVTLFDAADGSVLSGVNFFGRENFQNITPIEFPRGSEGVLALKTDSESENCECSNLKWNLDEPEVSFTHIFINGRMKSFDERYSPCVFMRYSVEKSYISPVIVDEYRKKCERKQELIRQENKTFGDILFVNMTDSYENLPEKLLNLLVQSNEENDFEYLLKADDDSIIDIPRVIKGLKAKDEHGLMCWSFFNEYRQVPLFGKWRDSQYESATYPPFPCGGGYVLSRKAVKLLAKNAKYLRKLPGEDVSLGVWLAAFNVNKTDDVMDAPGYKAVMLRVCEPICAWTCDRGKRLKSYRPNCNLVQQDIERLTDAWEDYRKYGYLRDYT